MFSLFRSNTNYEPTTTISWKIHQYQLMTNLLCKKKLQIIMYLGKKAINDTSSCSGLANHLSFSLLQSREIVPLNRRIVTISAETLRNLKC